MTSTFSHSVDSGFVSFYSVEPYYKALFMYQLFQSKQNNWEFCRKIQDGRNIMLKSGKTHWDS